MLKLKELRKLNNKKQKDIAKDLNLSVQAYCNYENGDLEPNFDTLIKLANYFGVSIDYLLGHEVKSQGSAVVERPDYALSDKFASDYKELLTDKNFLDITKLCAAVTPEMVAVAFGYLVAFFQSRGVNTQAILGY